MIVRGYVFVKAPNHPRARDGGYVAEHILVAEKALGKHLPAGAVVHHVNGQPGDNRPSNLVICQGNGYHLLLHQRQRGYEATGNPRARKCRYCRRYDIPGADMSLCSYSSSNGPETQAYHKSCAARHRREQKAEAKSGLGFVRACVICGAMQSRQEKNPAWYDLSDNEPSVEFCWQERGNHMLNQLALFEADGGVWMIEAIKNIQEFLATNCPGIPVLY